MSFTSIMYSRQPPFLYYHGEFLMNLPRSATRPIAFANRDDRLPPRATVRGDVPPRWETDRVWEEAGIIPPLRQRLLTELLHRLAMGEEASVALLARTLSRVSFEDAQCQVTHPSRLRHAAGDFGLCIAGRTDEAIAYDVASAVIEEYIRSNHP